MHHLRLILLFLLLPVCAPAKDPYQPRQLSEKETLKIYTSIMRDACLHADQFWTNSSFDPRAGRWGSGRSDQMNEGIRSISGMVLTCGALLKYSDVLSATERQEFLKKSTAAVRFAVATHRSGTEKCPDGKPWGGSWQSAMWTGTLGMGAWLIWDKLDAGLQKDLERILASESDRFLGDKPPAGTAGDTKAEENGWNMICLSLTANMFPQNPHAAAWNDKAIEYMMNTLSAPQDRLDGTLVDGRPVSEWFSGENVHPDFTLENHGFFHPSYIGCSSYFLTEAAMHYTLAGRPVPQAAAHHLLDTWRMFQGFILPCGESAFPQGMDWELHGLPFINLYASLGSWQKDPLAARMEKISLQYIRSLQNMCQGDLAVPGSRLGFTRHTCTIDQVTFGFLAHQIFGPPVTEMSARQAAAQVEGFRSSDFVQIVSHRTENKFVSFSWTNRIMGMVIPIGAGHAGNPDFTVPIINGLVGTYELNPKVKAAAKIVDHAWKQTTNGFVTTGTLLLNGGKLRQTLSLTSIGESAVVYQDRVTALSDVRVTRAGGVPVGIENDQVTGGTREVSYQNGRTNFVWKNVQKPFTFPGSWANVDGRLGVVMIAGTGLTYSQATGYHPGMAVCPDILYSSYSDQPRNFKAGDEIAHHVTLLLLEVTPKKTAALARSFKIETRPDGQLLRFHLPEGGEAEIPLL